MPLKKPFRYSHGTLEIRKTMRFKNLPFLMPSLFFKNNHGLENVKNGESLKKCKFKNRQSM